MAFRGSAATAVSCATWFAAGGHLQHAHYACGGVAVLVALAWCRDQIGDRLATMTAAGASKQTTGAGAKGKGGVKGGPKSPEAKLFSLEATKDSKPWFNSCNLLQTPTHPDALPASPKFGRQFSDSTEKRKDSGAKLPYHEPLVVTRCARLEISWGRCWGWGWGDRIRICLPARFMRSTVQPLPVPPTYTHTHTTSASAAPT